MLVGKTGASLMNDNYTISKKIEDQISLNLGKAKRRYFSNWRLLALGNNTG